MGKAIYVICGVNIVASATALFLIFRKPEPQKLTLNPRVAQSPQEQVTPAEAWKNFEGAGSFQAAVEALAKLPTDEQSLSRVAQHAASRIQEARQFNFDEINRVAACLRYLGAHAEWGSPHVGFLQTVAKDPLASVAARDWALRGVVDIAARKHAADKDPASGWRTELADFLTLSEFGVETSIEGLALQASHFVTQRGIASIPSERLERRIESILKQHGTAQESTLIAALDACARAPQAKWTTEVRAIADNPRSEGILQAAVIALGRLGQAEDRERIAQVNISSPALFEACQTALASLPRQEPVGQ